eukprot:comp20741_c0_seq1/m.27152 comp20741_c0_seq1/g.27152  ORF comp20741_c0_seq1/g.27152 comp20741_c0_seq1/m.27152 type:complete len:1028 (-) comp20741_c0_seq1:248-3331(-)
MVYKPPARPSDGVGGKPYGGSSPNGGPQYVSVPTNEHENIVVHAPSQPTVRGYCLKYGRVILILCLFFVPLTYLFVRHGSQVAAVASDGLGAISQLGIGGNGTWGEKEGSVANVQSVTDSKGDDSDDRIMEDTNEREGEGKEEGGKDSKVEEGKEKETEGKDPESEVKEEEEKENKGRAGKAEEEAKEEKGDEREEEEGQDVEEGGEGNDTTTLSVTVNVSAVEGNETVSEQEEKKNGADTGVETNGTTLEVKSDEKKGEMKEGVSEEDKRNEIKTVVGEENNGNTTVTEGTEKVVGNEDSKEGGAGNEEKTEGKVVEGTKGDEGNEGEEKENTGVAETETGEKQGAKDEEKEGEMKKVEGDVIEEQSNDDKKEQNEEDGSKKNKEEEKKMGDEETVDIEKEEEEEEKSEMKEVGEGEQGGEEVKLTIKEKTKWFHVGIVPDEAPRCLDRDDFLFPVDGNATQAGVSAKPQGKCKKTLYVIANENSCRAPRGEFFDFSANVTPREFDATPVVVCQQQAMPKDTCSENCTFDHIFPYFYSIGGRKEDMGPASLQWLQSLDTGRGYLNRAKNPFFFKFSAGNLSFSEDGSMVMFDFNEKHEALPNQNPPSEDVSDEKQRVGGELGGSYYYVQVEVSSCDNQDGPVDVITSACQIYDHFNGSYVVQCPIGTASELFVKGGSNMLAISVTMTLEYTHFRGWNPSVRGTRNPALGDRFISDAALNIPVMSSVPMATVYRPIKTVGDAAGDQSEARECTREEAWNAGEFGGAWINWKGGETTFVPTAMCKIANYDRAIKDINVRNQLTSCLNDKTGSISMNGASHMRFSYDEIAERLGIRNRYLPLHHLDHNYLNGKLIHRHWQWFHDVNNGIGNDLFHNSARQGDSMGQGLRPGDYYAIQTGAWNTAHCYNSGDNLPKYDAVIKQLMSLQQISNATIVIMSSPMYPRDEVEYRHLRRNSMVQALSEINRAYAEKLGKRVKYLDFYGIGIVKANLRVCKNHFVCPEYVYSTHGLVGKLVVDAFLNGVCGELSQ